MKFIWKNRKGCIRRVVVLLSCTTPSREDAIVKALFTKGRGRYRYCIHPDLITPTIVRNLKKSVYDDLDIISNEMKKLGYM
jgi:hypothetical protein